MPMAATIITLAIAAQNRAIPLISHRHTKKGTIFGFELSHTQTTISEQKAKERSKRRKSYTHGRNRRNTVYRHTHTTSMLSAYREYNLQGFAAFVRMPSRN